MRKIKLILIGLSVIMITCTTLNAKSDTYYADLIADFYIINKQASAEGYRLNDTLSRAELAKIATNLSGFSVEKCTGGIYADVKSNLGDLCGYIETLAKSQIISTSNKYFRPNDTITRAEAIKILLGAIGEGKSTTTAGYVDTKNLGDLEGYINRAREIGSIPNTEYIYPNSTILRYEVFMLASFYAGIDSSTPAFQNDSSISYSTQSVSDTRASKIDSSEIKIIEKYSWGGNWYSSTFGSYATAHPDERDFIAKCDTVMKLEFENKILPYPVYSPNEPPCFEGFEAYGNGKDIYEYNCNYSSEDDYDNEGHPIQRTSVNIERSIIMSVAENKLCGKIWLQQEGI